MSRTIKSFLKEDQVVLKESNDEVFIADMIVPNYSEHDGSYVICDENTHEFVNDIFRDLWVDYRNPAAISDKILYNIFVKNSYENKPTTEHLYLSKIDESRVPYESNDVFIDKTIGYAQGILLFIQRCQSIINDSQLFHPNHQNIETIKNGKFSIYKLTLSPQVVKVNV